MSLGDEQRQFVFYVGKLITYAYAIGYELSFGDTYPFRKHRADSFHKKGLAIDLNLFKNREYLIRTEDHQQLGEYWESLHPKCTWGGRWNDGNHYSWGEGQ
jgi:hypothetical protein